MKIAMSSAEEDLNGEVSSVLGRCLYFLIVEIEDDKIKRFEAIKNTSVNQMSGAGVSAAQLVAEKDIEAVITGNIGPRALDVFRQFNIKVYSASGLKKEVLQKFIDNELEEIK